MAITVHAWQLSVTESSHSRHKKAVSMSHIEKFDLRAFHDALLGHAAVPLSTLRLIITAG